MFNVGQRVRVVKGTGSLRDGDIYTVVRNDGLMIKIDFMNSIGRWYTWRFEPVIPLTPLELDVQAWITTEMEALRG